jgi:hypothetical protein
LILKCNYSSTEHTKKSIESTYNDKVFIAKSAKETDKSEFSKDMKINQVCSYLYIELLLWEFNQIENILTNIACRFPSRPTAYQEKNRNTMTSFLYFHRQFFFSFFSVLIE